MRVTTHTHSVIAVRFSLPGIIAAASYFASGIFRPKDYKEDGQPPREMDANLKAAQDFLGIKDPEALEVGIVQGLQLSRLYMCLHRSRY